MIVAMSGKEAGYTFLRRGESGARTTRQKRERFIGYSFLLLLFLFLLLDGLQKSDGSDRKRRTSKGRGKNRNSGLIGKVIGGRRICQTLQ